MNICIRVDSSVSIGTGHVMRCLVIADQLKEASANVYFAIRSEEGHLGTLIEKQGYPVYELSADKAFSQTDDAKSFTLCMKQHGQVPDWILVDHYGIDAVWEQQVKEELCANLAIIDDLADRPHDCRILLDHNYYKNGETRYKHLVPANCIMMLGPAFLILRPEFQLEKRKRDSNPCNRFLVFFGGSDPTNETEN